MKIFIPNQKYFALLGISRQQSMQPFNAKNLLSFLILFLLVILCGGFLVCDANNLNEYTESIYITSVTITIATIFLTFIWNMNEFFNFIDEWEKIVEQS